MSKGMWPGIALLVVTVVALFAIILANAEPKDPSAAAKAYVEAGYGVQCRVVAEKRDSHLHEGFPDKYQVTCVLLDDAGQDQGEEFNVWVRYTGDGINLTDGGHSWSGDHCVAEAKAFHAAAAKVLDRPLSEVKTSPRSLFKRADEIAKWGPFANDPEMLYEVELVVFGDAEQDGPAVTQFLVGYLPRWAGARTVRVQVGFVGDRRDKVDEVFKGIGHGWAHNIDTRWHVELEGAAIGAVTADSLQAANAVNFPAKEAQAEQAGESK